ncbi:MAG: 30S ribosomal protein S6 [Candidatus Marinimicrobia bacterium]|nr:30S ribosomal protein S6 [Candidatus Neomarinimicrobiota bacterium]|tara:strand:+ start:1282 stop:1707 length:426 start_codon:yes stop_codon:yes gene_type:complete
MRYYETIYIVDPNLENSVLEKTMNQIGQELEKTKAKIINHREWGKKRLAYQVAKQKYGSFILLQYEVEDLSEMQDFELLLKLNSLVLRHMTVSLNERPEEYVDKSIANENTDTEVVPKNIQNESDVDKSIDVESIEKNKGK